MSVGLLEAVPLAARLSTHLDGLVKLLEEAEEVECRVKTQIPTQQANTPSAPRTRYFFLRCLGSGSCHLKLLSADGGVEDLKPCDVGALFKGIQSPEVDQSALVGEDGFRE